MFVYIRVYYNHILENGLKDFDQICNLGVEKKGRKISSLGKYIIFRAEFYHPGTEIFKWDGNDFKTR